ncbi:MAG TPA: acyltransferase [Syntrophorhabdaceae bacterium]|nr:acyltransferase [Syntrophorhabdaceae bacterium]
MIKMTVKIFLNVFKKFNTLFYIFYNRIYLWSNNIRFGKNMRITGSVTLIIRGKSENITVGNDFTCLGELVLNNRENGKIIIGDNVFFDKNVEICAARDATVAIAGKVTICPRFILNAGTDVSIGESTVIAANCNINASERQRVIGIEMIRQEYLHAPISIGSDVWFGVGVSVLKGVKIGDGAIIGSNAVVASDIDDNAVAVGVPAKTVKFRE